VPFARDAFADANDPSKPALASVRTLPAGLPCYRHIGIYAYRADFLRAYPRLERSSLKDSKALEQLRALWHGYAIARRVRQDAPLTGVDTAETWNAHGRCLTARIITVSSECLREADPPGTTGRR